MTGDDRRGSQAASSRAAPMMAPGTRDWISRDGRIRGSGRVGEEKRRLNASRHGVETEPGAALAH